MQIKFTVHAVPVAQPRQRHRIFGQAGGPQFVSNYTPKKDPVNAFKSCVRDAANKAYSGAPLDCALSVRIDAVFPRPKCKFYKTKPNPREWKPTKPDWDNLGKSVCDALNQLTYRDDAQIASCTINKYIADAIEQPSVTITISTI